MTSPSPFDAVLEYMRNRPTTPPSTVATIFKLTPAERVWAESLNKPALHPWREYLGRRHLERLCKTAETSPVKAIESVAGVCPRPIAYALLRYLNLATIDARPVDVSTEDEEELRSSIARMHERGATKADIQRALFIPMEQINAVIPTSAAGSEVGRIAAAVREVAKMNRSKT